MLSAQLPEGERVQIVIPPTVPAGTVSITIRRPSTSVMTLADIWFVLFILIVVVQTLFDLYFPQVSLSAHICGLTSGFILGLLVAPRSEAL